MLEVASSRHPIYTEIVAGPHPFKDSSWILTIASYCTRTLARDGTASFVCSLIPILPRGNRSIEAFRKIKTTQQLPISAKTGTSGIEFLKSSACVRGTCKHTSPSVDRPNLDGPIQL